MLIFYRVVLDFSIIWNFLELFQVAWMAANLFLEIYKFGKQAFRKPETVINYYGCS